jgi:hypothetical protein
MVQSDKKKPKLTDAEQSKRFIAAARIAEADEDSEALNRAFARLDIKTTRRPSNDAPRKGGHNPK